MLLTSLSRIALSILFVISPFMLHAQTPLEDAKTWVELDKNIQKMEDVYRKAKADIDSLRGTRKELYTELNDAYKDGGLARVKGMRAAFKIIGSSLTSDALSQRISEREAMHELLKADGAALKARVSNLSINDPRRPNLLTQLDLMHKDLAEIRAETSVLQEMNKILNDVNADASTASKSALGAANRALDAFNESANDIARKAKPPVVVLRVDPSIHKPPAPHEIPPHARSSGVVGERIAGRMFGGGLRVFSHPLMDLPFFDIIDLLTGVEPQDYIDLYQSYRARDRARLAQINPAIAKLERDIGQVKIVFGSMVGDRMEKKRRELTRLLIEQKNLEINLQKLEDAIIKNSLEHARRLMIEGRGYGVNREEVGT